MQEIITHLRNHSTSRQSDGIGKIRIRRLADLRGHDSLNLCRLHPRISLSRRHRFCLARLWLFSVQFLRLEPLLCCSPMPLRAVPSQTQQAFRRRLLLLLLFLLGIFAEGGPAQPSELCRSSAGNLSRRRADGGGLEKAPRSWHPNRDRSADREGKTAPSRKTRQNSTVLSAFIFPWAPKPRQRSRLIPFWRL